jgi:hypothetical protein
MPFAHDEHAVGAFATNGAHPAFGEGVRSGLRVPRIPSERVMSMSDHVEVPAQHRLGADQQPDMTQQALLRSLVGRSRQA